MAAEIGRPAVVAALFPYLPAASDEEDSRVEQGALPRRKTLDKPSQSPDIGVNAVDEDGRTPLHYAAAKGHTAVVALLLRHGAHCGVVDTMGLTPLYNAAALGHGAIVDQLKSEHHPAAAVSTPMHGAAKYGRVALFSKPQLRPFVSATDETGTTPLHIAASAVDAPSVSALVGLGADVHRRNEDGDTPLHGAVAWLERAVRAAETDNTRAADREGVGRRLRGAAAGHLVRRGQPDGELDLAGVPLRVSRKLGDFRAVVLCFLAAGVRVERVGHRGIRLLCLRIARGADGFGPRQFARLAITGRARRPDADEEPPPGTSG